MKKFFILIIPALLFSACSHHISSGYPENTEKINACVLVYLPENFLHYQSSHSSVLRSLSFKFNEPVTQYLPAFLNNTFAKADFTDKKSGLSDDCDYLVIPGFEKVTFDSDRTFGHELRVTVSMSFNPAGSTAPFTVKGTGLAEDMYGGRTIYEKELAEKAFADALNDLKKNIQSKRSELETPDQ